MWCLHALHQIVGQGCMKLKGALDNALLHVVIFHLDHTQSMIISRVVKDAIIDRAMSVVTTKVVFNGICKELSDVECVSLFSLRFAR